MSNLNSFKENIHTLAEIPEKEWIYIQSFFKEEHFDKGDHLLRAGEIPEYIYFCISGLVRMYYTTENGVEYNKSFCQKNEFVTSYSAGLLRIPSLLSIQTLESSDFVALPFTILPNLLERHPSWERLNRKLVEMLYIKKEQKEMQLLLLSAEQRYRAFLDEYSHQEKNIPNYHIASYLGITPVALSRIRSSLKKEEMN